MSELNQSIYPGEYFYVETPEGEVYGRVLELEREGNSSKVVLAWRKGMVIQEEREELYYIGRTHRVLCSANVPMDIKSVLDRAFDEYCAE